MHEKTETLYELCETISRELDEANEKIRKAGGKLTAGDTDYIDKLTHSLKSIKTTIAMMEAEEDGGYSGRMMPYYGRMSYSDGDNGSGIGTTGRSYARGRGARRDSIGRYSREGNSYGGGYSMADDDFRMELEELMKSAPNEQVRQKLQRMMSEM